MPVTSAAKNVMLDPLASRILYASLHRAAPSTDGRNEITGGTPAYARRPVMWAAASGGAVALSAPVRFDVPAGDVAYCGLWSAATGGTFYGSGILTRDTFVAQGTYELTRLTILLEDSLESPA